MTKLNFFFGIFWVVSQPNDHAINDFHFSTDVNECRSRKHACDQVCTNTEGSFMCGCHAGYIVSNDSKSCQGKLTSQLCRIHFKTS